MSYCRCGDDSDVYVWAGDKYCIALCAGKEKVSQIIKDNNLKQTYHYDTEKETLNQCNCKALNRDKS